jgi:hypothetical protein
MHETRRRALLRRRVLCGAVPRKEQQKGRTMKAWTNVTGLRRRAFAVLAVGVVAASSATPAAAVPSPAQHFALVPLTDEPLRKGFVEVIHPDGPQVYAHHVYQLNGARSDQSYEVVISIWTSNLVCAGDPAFVLPAAVVDTNPSGNGRADVVFAPEQLDALGLRGLAIGGNVTLFDDGSPAYATGCRMIQLD